MHDKEILGAVAECVLGTTFDAHIFLALSLHVALPEGSQLLPIAANCMRASQFPSCVPSASRRVLAAGLHPSPTPAPILASHSCPSAPSPVCNCSQHRAVRQQPCKEKSSWARAVGALLPLLQLSWAWGKGGRVIGTNPPYPPLMAAG